MKNGKKKILLLIASSLITLLLAVFLIELYHYFKNQDHWISEVARFDPQLGWSHIPSYSLARNGKSITTNSLGFRSDEIDPTRDHVLVVGDSVAFGAGVGDHETVSYYLDRELKEAQVLNLAVAGYGIDQYYLTLERHINQTNPKQIVVIIYTSNDLADTRSDDLFGTSKPLFKVERNRLKNQRPVISRYSCPNLFSRSWLGTLFPSKSLDKIFCTTTDLELSAARTTIERLFVEMSQLANQHGADLLFVLSPTLTGVQWDICNFRGLPASCRTLDGVFYENYLLFLGIFESSSHEFLDFNNVLIHRYLKKDVNLKALYNGNGKDVHHYSPQGNMFLAKTILRYLEKKSSNSPLGDIKSTGGKTSFPKSQAHFNQGLMAWDMGQNEKAIEAFGKFLQARPRHAEAHFLLGLAHKNSGQLDAAIREIQASIRIDPKRAEPHKTLGDLYTQTKDFQNAIGEFKITLELRPSFPDAYFNLGLAFDGIEDGPNAAFNIMLSLKLYEYARQDSLQLMAQEKLADIVKKYGMNLDSLEESFPGPKWWAAMTGANVLKKLLAEDPDNIDRRYRLGLVYLESNRYEHAAAEFKKVVEMFPEAALAFNSLAFVLMEMGRYKEAIKALQEALNVNKDYASAHLNLGISYDFLNDGRQAIIHAYRAERLFGGLKETENEARAKSHLENFFRKYGYRAEEFSEEIPSGEQGY